MNLDLGTVIARRFELVDEIERRTKEFQASISGLNEELTLCEQFVKQEMTTQNLQNVKTASGTPYFTTKDRVRITAWDDTIAFVNEHNLHHMLTRQLAKDAVREYMKENGGALPPGVAYEQFKDLNWKR